MVFLKEFKALSDETRVRIINILFQGERCVCEIQAVLRMSEPRISRHLRILKEAGLVVSRTEGKWSYYSLRPDEDNEILFSYLRAKIKENKFFSGDLERVKKLTMTCGS